MEWSHSVANASETCSTYRSGEPNHDDLNSIWIPHILVFLKTEHSFLYYNVRFFDNSCLSSWRCLWGARLKLYIFFLSSNTFCHGCWKIAHTFWGLHRKWYLNGLRSGLSVDFPRVTEMWLEPRRIWFCSTISKWAEKGNDDFLSGRELQLLRDAVDFLPNEDTCLGPSIPRWFPASKIYLNVF